MSLEPESSQHARRSDALSRSFSPEGLKEAVRSGTRWTAVAQAASHIVSLVVLGTLYRFVSPDEFGLMGMVMPVLLFVRIFTALGLNVATVQRAELDHGRVNSLFWVNVLLGLATTVAAAALAPGVAWLNDEPAVLGLTVAMSGVSLIVALGLQHTALLERKLRVGPLAAARLVAQVGGGAAGIAAALAGAGVWALAAQQYVELCLQSALAWLLEPWRPDRPTRGAGVRELVRIGAVFTASNVVFYLLGNMDKILVGAVFGPRALGFYSQAFNIMMKPVYVMTAPLGSVMLAGLSRSVGDRESYRQVLTAFLRLISVGGFPAGVGLTLVARDVMLVLGGERWTEAGVLLAALAPVVIAQGTINMAGNIYTSAGRWVAMFWAASAMAVALLAALLIGAWIGRTTGDGALAVAYAYSFTVCVLLFVPYVSAGLIASGVRPREWYAQLIRPALAALAMGAVVWGVRAGMLHTAAPAFVRLLVEVAVGAAVYAALALNDVRWCLAQLRRNRPASDTG